MSRRGRGEGTIHHRASDGRWVAALRPGPGLRRRWYYGATRGEVQRKLDRARRELELGMPGNAGPPRLEAFIGDWLKTLEGSGRVREITVRRYRQLLTGHVLPDLGHVRLDKLSVDAVQELLNRKAKELGPQSVSHVRATLRTALNGAMRRELIGRNVASLAQVPAIQASERGFLTPAQAKRLLEVVRGDPLEVMYSVGISLGLRPSEILGLRWEDVDLEAGRLRVRVQLLQERPPRLAPLKTRASTRTIDLPEATSTALRSHKARQAKQQLAAKKWGRWGLVLTTDAGEPLNLNYVRDRFYEALELAGLPRITLYDATRHSCASLLAGQGIHPKIAQRVLGHAQVGTTMNIYTHVSPESLKEAAAAIDRALS